MFGVVLAQSYPESERITDFSSDIKVNSDASILVTENITVYANGTTISHGIYRDFPTTYKDKLGNKYIVNFEVKDVRLNSLPEEYVIESLSNGVRVKIGKANVLLNPGRYTYSLTYQATRELGFFTDHDELYWNVTGNGWNYNIEKVSVTVTLPNGINPKDIKTSAYTGLSGSKDNAANTYVLSDGKVNFVTAGTLAPKEGLTIAVSWPKGFVILPTAEQKMAYWWQDNKAVVFDVFGLLVVLGYFLFVWNKYGRDPQGKTIIAQYEPPKNISPAEARFLLNRNFDDKCLVADIINLAVKGYIKIDKKYSHYNLTLTDKVRVDSVISDSEKVILDTMFEKGNVVDIGSYDSDFLAAKNDFLFWINDNYKKNYFTNNTKYLIIGLVLSLIILIFSAWNEGPAVMGVVAFMSIWLSIWTLGVTSMIFSIIKLFRDSKFGQTILFSVFSLPFLAGEAVALYIVYINVSLAFLIFLILLVSLTTTFYFLLKQYTETGLRLVEEINGFKLFLSVTEKDRMNFHNPPERTPELFEKYLPYAVALGVENKWAEQFAEVFARDNMMDKHPVWYSGSIYGAGALSGFNSGFSSSVSSSTTAPGSSSGGGGGGSSGGGGGGGGGGGW
jgi:uncharacterized membrane protein YgcG